MVVFVVVLVSLDIFWIVFWRFCLFNCILVCVRMVLVVLFLILFFLCIENIDCKLRFNCWMKVFVLVVCFVIRMLWFRCEKVFVSVFLFFMLVLENVCRFCEGVFILVSIWIVFNFVVNGLFFWVVWVRFVRDKVSVVFLVLLVFVFDLMLIKCLLILFILFWGVRFFNMFIKFVGGVVFFNFVICEEMVLICWVVVLICLLSFVLREVIVDLSVVSWFWIFFMWFLICVIEVFVVLLFVLVGWLFLLVIVLVVDVERFEIVCLSLEMCVVKLFICGLGCGVVWVVLFKWFFIWVYFLSVLVIFCWIIVKLDFNVVRWLVFLWFNGCLMGLEESVLGEGGFGEVVWRFK